MRKCITVYFVSGQKLRLFGTHVTNFLENYAKCIENNSYAMFSVAEDTVMLTMDKIEFVKLHEVEDESNE